MRLLAIRQVDMSPYGRPSGDFSATLCMNTILLWCNLKCIWKMVSASTSLTAHHKHHWSTHKKQHSPHSSSCAKLISLLRLFYTHDSLYTTPGQITNGSGGSEELMYLTSLGWRGLMLWEEYTQCTPTTKHASTSECFCMRFQAQLPGPQNSEWQPVSNFRDACQQGGLLETDHQWHEAINDAILTTSTQVCRLFAMMLFICHPADPAHYWNTHKDVMTEHYLHQYNLRMKNMALQYHEQIYHRALIDIEDHTVWSSEVWFTLTTWLAKHLGAMALNHQTGQSNTNCRHMSSVRQATTQTTCESFSMRMRKSSYMNNEQPLMTSFLTLVTNEKTLFSWMHHGEQAKHFSWTWSLPKCDDTRGLH